MVLEKWNRLTGMDIKKGRNQINRQGYHIIYFCCCRSDKVADIETGLLSHCYHPWPSAAEEWHSLSFAWWVMYEELGRAYAPVLYDKAKESFLLFFLLFPFVFSLKHVEPGSTYRRECFEEVKKQKEKQQKKTGTNPPREYICVCMYASVRMYVAFSAGARKSVASVRGCAGTRGGWCAHLPSCVPVCVFCGCGSRARRGVGGCWCANVHHVEGLWMGRCDVKRDPNAGAYLEAVKGAVCHIPGDYLSKPQHQLSHQETGRKSNFLDRSTRLVSKFCFYLRYCQLGQHLSSLILCIACVNVKLSCETLNRSWNVLETYLDLQRFARQLNLCSVDFMRLCEAV